MTSRKPQLLFILPGPIYDPNTSLQRKFEALSEFYCGHVVSTADETFSANFSEFELSLVGNKAKYGLILNIKLLIKAFQIAYRGNIKNQPVELVVTYDPIKTGLIGCLLKFIFRAKLVVEVNGVYDSPVLYDRMGHFQSRIRRKLITKIAGFVLSKADAIKQLYDGQLKNFSANIKTPNIHTFFDYSDADRFKNLGENKEILFVGHPFHIKGIDILIEAFDAISGKNNNWHLKILGWHTGADLDYIKSACTKNKQISYHPPVRAREMVTHIGSCGILALPSRTEAMGRVLIEAMAAEKPRIASNVDGIPSVIKDNEDGLLFEAENSHQLASKLDLLISDNALRARLAKNGYNRYTSAFKLKHYIEHCKKLFNSTLN